MGYNIRKVQIDFLNKLDNIISKMDADITIVKPKIFIKKIKEKVDEDINSNI